MLKNKMVEMVEVGPRDGLQNEAAIVSTADKLQLIHRAIAYGARRIEVTSFVNPRRVPQLADAEELVAMLPDRDDVTYIGLVLNRRGAERALETGRIDELGAVCVTSDTFGIRNQGQTAAESLDTAIGWKRRADYHRHRLWLSVRRRDRDRSCGRDGQARGRRGTA
jgi:hydroxymethylglutaryl-CoA lyase